MSWLCKYHVIYEDFQVGDNGIIDLNNNYNSYLPESLPINGNPFIAPYWADVDLRAMTGNVFYRQTRDPALLARATNEIRAAFPMSQGVTVYSLLIVTWDSVGYYPISIDKVGLYIHSITYVCTKYFIYIICAYSTLPVRMYCNCKLVRSRIAHHLLCIYTCVCVKNSYKYQLKI